MSIAEDKEDNNALEIEAKFENLREILGRQSKVNEIIDDLKTLQPNKPFVVIGPPGIGKTEICRCVYKALKEEIYDLYMPFIDCMSVSDINTLIEAVNRALRVHIPDGITYDGKLNLIKDHLFKMNKSRSKVVIYFDNWETIWYGLKNSDTEIDLLISLLQLIKACGCYILISTTSCLEGIESKEYEINELESPFDRDLFQSIYAPKEGYRDEKTLSCLLSELSGYPLAIVLVAYQAKRYPNLNLVLEKWRVASAKTGTSKHKSMRSAVLMSWSAICHLESAKETWGVMSIIAGDISYELLQEIMEPKYSDEWMDGLEELLNINVLTYKNQNISMLSPLKELCFCFNENYNHDLKNKCMCMIIDVFLKRVLNACNDEPDHYTSLNRLYSVYDEILNVIEKMCLTKYKYANDNFDSLVLNMCSYYDRSPKSLQLLKELIPYYENNKMLSACLLKSRGDIQRLMGDLISAEESYLKAEHLFRCENNYIGIASVLNNFSELQSRLGKPKEAEKKLEEAEYWYRLSHSSIGLARNLMSRGIILSRAGKVSNAKKSFKEAELIYRQCKAFHGVANVLWYYGELQRNSSNYVGAKKSFIDAETLFREEKDNLGLANVLLSLGTLNLVCGDVESIEMYFAEAEKLYSEEKHRLGVANVIMNRGIFQSQQGLVKQALNCFDKAEKLFLEERTDVSRANVLVKRGELQLRENDLKGAENSFNEARKIFKEHEQMLGLANALKLSGDLKCKVGVMNDAAKLYFDAEQLYREVHNELGIANIFYRYGDIKAKTGHIEKALQYYEDAEIMFANLNNHVGLANVYFSIGQLLIKYYDKFEEGFELLEKAKSIYETLQIMDVVVLMQKAIDEMREKNVKRVR